MVFAVNTRDEAKVVVPHNILANTLNNVQPPVPVVDHDISQRVEFMQVGKQNAWDAMSISCPADSPARDFGHPAFPSPVPYLTLNRPSWNRRCTRNGTMIGSFRGFIMSPSTWIWVTSLRSFDNPKAIA